MKSRVLTIAREDFEQALRDRLLWGAFTLISLLVVPLFWRNAHGRYTDTAQKAVSTFPSIFRTYIVILVVVIAYKAIVGERESGTIRLLLGLPSTRRDIVLGKLISKTTLLVSTLVPLLLVLSVIVLIKHGTVPLGTFVLMSIWVVLYGLVWTSFTLGISAAFSSQYRVLAVVLGMYLLFAPQTNIWVGLVNPLFAVLFTGTPSTPRLSVAQNATGPSWYVYSQRLNPTFTFQITGDWVISLTNPAVSIPNVLPAIFSIAILLLFGTVPLLACYWKFRGADLG